HSFPTRRSSDLASEPVGRAFGTNRENIHLGGHAEAKQGGRSRSAGTHAPDCPAAGAGACANETGARPSFEAAAAGAAARAKRIPRRGSQTEISRLRAQGEA